MAPGAGYETLATKLERDVMFSLFFAICIVGLLSSLKVDNCRRAKRDRIRSEYRRRREDRRLLDKL